MQHSAAHFSVPPSSQLAACEGMARPIDARCRRQPASTPVHVKWKCVGLFYSGAPSVVPAVRQAGCMGSEWERNRDDKHRISSPTVMRTEYLDLDARNNWSAHCSFRQRFRFVPAANLRVGRLPIRGGRHRISQKKTSALVTKESTSWRACFRMIRNLMQRQEPWILLHPSTSCLWATADV